jgi:hypothetical protein
MQCREFEERMHYLLDERRAPQDDAQLQSHAQSCAACRQLLFDQEALFRGISSFRTPSLPRGFSTRVVSQAQLPTAAAVPGRAGKQRPWLLAAAVISIAAGALIVLSIGMNQWPDAGNGRGTAGTSAPRASGGGQSSDPRVAADRETSNTAAASQLDEPGSKPLAAANVNSLEQYGQALQSLAAQVPQAVDRLDEVEEATPGLRPVRTSFTLAIGTIRRTIPPPRKQVQPQPGKRDSGMAWSAANVVA